MSTTTTQLPPEPPAEHSFHLHIRSALWSDVALIECDAGSRQSVERRCSHSLVVRAHVVPTCSLTFYSFTTQQSAGRRICFTDWAWAKRRISGFIYYFQSIINTSNQRRGKVTFLISFSWNRYPSENRLFYFLKFLQFLSIWNLTQNKGLMFYLHSGSPKPFLRLKIFLNHAREGLHEISEKVFCF